MPRPIRPVHPRTDRLFSSTPQPTSPGPTSPDGARLSWQKTTLEGITQSGAPGPSLNWRPVRAGRPWVGPRHGQGHGSGAGLTARPTDTICHKWHRHPTRLREGRAERSPSVFRLGPGFPTRPDVRCVQTGAGTPDPSCCCDHCCIGRATGSGSMSGDCPALQTWHSPRVGRWFGCTAVGGMPTMDAVTRRSRRPGSISGRPSSPGTANETPRTWSACAEWGGTPSWFGNASWRILMRCMFVSAGSSVRPGMSAKPTDPRGRATPPIAEDERTPWTVVTRPTSPTASSQAVRAVRILGRGHTWPLHVACGNATASCRALLRGRHGSGAAPRSRATCRLSLKRRRRRYRSVGQFRPATAGLPLWQGPPPSRSPPRAHPAPRPG